MEVKTFSLSELLSSVRRFLEKTYNGRYWVRAETSDVRRAGGSGHCYLELLEKGEGGNVRSRVRASIWAHTYEQVERSFREAGLSGLSSGMNILALVQVSFHEQYGLSLNIVDIDPNYSLGDIARQRQETIARLKREQVLEDNKGLELPRPLVRLAIISSPTAAGLGDFLDQLRGNRYSFHFYTALFVAQMQGDQTTGSVIAAMERVLQNADAFDAVIIIRGGGAVSELRAFDDYALCYYCTQYPLPIICGIGHERDESVLDLVAHTSLKTPTAVAEYLIHSLLDEWTAVQSLVQRLRNASYQLSLGRRREMDALTLRLPSIAGRRLRLVHEEMDRLRQAVRSSASHVTQRYKADVEKRLPLLHYIAKSRITRELKELDHLPRRLQASVAKHVELHTLRLDQYDQALRLAHPDKVLARGFALVERPSGAIVKGGEELLSGDLLRLRFASGQTEVIVR